MQVARRQRRPSAGLVTRNRQLAETALRPWTPVFIHGDLQVDHAFVGDEVTGILDWSEASQGDALRLNAALLGRSRGGLTSKVRLAADRRARPLALVVTAVRSPVAGRSSRCWARYESAGPSAVPHPAAGGRQQGLLVPR